MNFNNDKISSTQLGSVILLTMLGTGILTLPRALAEAVGPNGWLLIIIGTLISIGIMAIHGYIIKSFPGKSYMEIIAINLSKPVAYIVLFTFVIYFTILNGFLVRLFAEVVKMFLLLRTPIEIIIFSLLLLAAYLARQGIETLGRLAELLLPIIIIPSVILFTLSWQGSDVSNFMPILHITPQQILKGIPTILFSFLGFDLTIIFALYVNRPQKARKVTIKAISILGLIYLILNFSVIARFGVDQTVALIWPTISLFRTIDFPGLFIENVEGVVMALWVLIVFMSIAPLMLVKVVLLKDLIGGQDKRFLALPLLPWLYFAALWGDSIAEAYAYLDKFITYIAPVVVLVVPGLVLIAMTIRKRIKKEGTPGV